MEPNDEFSISVGEAEEKGAHEKNAGALTKFVTQVCMPMRMNKTNQHLVSGIHEVAPATEC